VPCNSQSAVARLNSCFRLCRCRAWRLQAVLTVGSSAMDAYELGQVRKEAAVSKLVHVPGECLTRAVIQECRLDRINQQQVHGTI